MNIGFPWLSPPLNTWSIVGMNHYHVAGQRFLFVAMTKNGQCIAEEGKDDKYLWNRLRHKADLHDSAEVQPNARSNS